MYSKTINYTDYNGVNCSEKLYFNFTKAELSEMELSEDGGLANRLQKIVDEKNRSEIMKFFKKLILDSYGVKSEDGKRFIKTEKLRNDFEYSLAFDAFYMLLLTNEKMQTEFVNGIVPKDLVQAVNQSKPKDI